MVVMVRVVVWSVGGLSRVGALAVGLAAVAVVGLVVAVGLVAGARAFRASEPCPPRSKASQREGPAERPNKIQRAQASRERYTTQAAAHLASTVERAPRRRGTHPARAVQ